MKSYTTFKLSILISVKNKFKEGRYALSFMTY